MSNLTKRPVTSKRTSMVLTADTVAGKRKVLPLSIAVTAVNLTTVGATVVVSSTSLGEQADTLIVITTIHNRLRSENIGVNFIIVINSISKNKSKLMSVVYFTSGKSKLPSVLF
jgi:hypothetical protein